MVICLWNDRTNFSFVTRDITRKIMKLFDWISCWRAYVKGDIWKKSAISFGMVASCLMLVEGEYKCDFFKDIIFLKPFQVFFRLFECFWQYLLKYDCLNLKVCKLFICKKSFLFQDGVLCFSKFCRCCSVKLNSIKFNIEDYVLSMANF